MTKKFASRQLTCRADRVHGSAVVRRDGRVEDDDAHLGSFGEVSGSEVTVGAVVALQIPHGQVRGVMVADTAAVSVDLGSSSRAALWSPTGVG